MHNTKMALDMLLPSWLVFKLYIGPVEIGAHKLEDVDAALGCEWVVPDGCHIEENGNHEETNELQAQAPDVPVVHNRCCQVVTDQSDTCKRIVY